MQLSIVENSDDSSQNDSPKDVLIEAEKFVATLFETQDDGKYPFHSFKFISDLVEVAREIADENVSDATQRERIAIAAWFIYSGFAQGHPAIAEKSLAFASEFLSEFNYPLDGCEQVLGFVKDFSKSGPPTSIAQEVLHDASIAFMAKKKFKKKFRLLREELEAIGQHKYTDSEWISYRNGLLASSKFYSVFAKRKYNAKLLQNLNELDNESLEISGNMPAVKIGRGLERGVDTLLRTQSRYLSNLVSLVDRKAQMIIGVNSISLSILISTFEDMVSARSAYMIPLGIFVTINLLTMIYAVLVISPRLPKHQVTSQEDILLKNGSLMAQLIFSEIDYANFKLGMQQAMTDEGYLYDIMLKNMYDTGRVLMSKFRRLQTAYRIFIFGIPAALLSFAAVFLLKIKL